MKLKYFELISPFPIKTNIGNIQSPTLKKIWDLGYQTYQSYLNFLLISPEMYCNVINPSLKQWYETRLHLNNNITLFDICQVDNNLIKTLEEIFNFYFIEDVSWNEDKKMFFISVTKDDEISLIGAINQTTWSDVIDIILQLSNIHIEEDTDNIKSNKAKAIMEKIKAGRKKMAEKDKSRKDFELDNLVSVVANRHSNLNILNIWGLTVNQLWDTFTRLMNDNIYGMTSRSVSVWGDEQKQFNANDWIKRIDSEN